MTAIRDNIEHVASTSADLTAERLEALKDLIPEAFTEGRIDMQRLREALGEIVDDRPERYTFTWAGRRDALRLLQTPSRGTLVPVPEESVQWDATKNIFIEGDNLEVLKLLYKSYAGRVTVAFIDPPYNTGKDFVYSDNFTDPLGTYLALTGQTSEHGDLLTSRTETAGRFHSSWLSMMYPRLVLARQLLSDNGAIFISVDDGEVKNLRMLLDEVFGEENFVANVVWQKKYAKQNDALWFSVSHDHILVYAKNKAQWRPQQLVRGDEQLKSYTNPDNDPRGPWQSVVYTCAKTRRERPNLYYPITHPRSGAEIFPSEDRVWGYDQSRHEQHVADNRLWWGENQEKDKPRLKVFLEDVGLGVVPDTLWLRSDAGDNQEAKREILSLFGRSVFDTPKPPTLIRRILQVATSPSEDQIVLDFFAGSGTTGQAVLEQNADDGGKRQFILVQLPEPIVDAEYKTIAEITRARLRRVLQRMAGAGEVELDENTNSVGDSGFRCFRLDASAFGLWQGISARESTAYASEMELFARGDIEVRPLEALICEVLLKEGYPLSSTVRDRHDIELNNVVEVHDEDRGQSFTICLDGVIHAETLSALMLAPDDLFVCRDAALTDELAANLALQCRLKTV